MSEYHLSWGTFKNNLCNGFSQLQQKEEFVDMTLAADGHLVKVHRSVMALASPYIKEMLQSTTCRDPVVFLNNVSHHVLSYILEYIYTGEVKVPKFTLNTFIKAAKALHITGIKDLIVPMVTQEFFHTSLPSEILSESLAESTAVKKHSSVHIRTNKIDVNTTQTEVNQPMAKDKNKFEDNSDLQTQCGTITVDSDYNTKDIDSMDVDMVQLQTNNTQTFKETSLLEKALENILCEDPNEACLLLQNGTDIMLNFREDEKARLQNYGESPPPDFNLEIKSCKEDNVNEYPTLSINVNNNLQTPDIASVSHTTLNPDKGKTHDASAPLYSLSERGSLQIILNRFIYNMHHSSHGNQKRRWRCTDYRKLNCKAYIDTSCDNIVERKNDHTHGFHDAKIVKKGVGQNIYSTIQAAEAASQAENNVTTGI